MRRVIIMPISDAASFTGLEVIAQSRNLAALVGWTTPGRSRDAYESNEEFLEAVAHGSADRYSFGTLDEAAVFAESKLDELARKGKEIEDELAARKKFPPDSERLSPSMDHTRSARRRA